MPLSDYLLPYRPGRATVVDQVSTSLWYVGYVAASRVPDDMSSPVFLIQRLVRVGGTVYSEYAGDGAFNCAWSLRASYFPPVTLTNQYSTYFDGINDNISFGNAFLYDRTNQFSMSFWIKPDNLAAQRCFYSKTTADANVYGLNLQVTTVGRVAIQMRSSGGTLAAWTGTTQAVQVAVWNHVVVTYDGSSNQNGFRAYVNAAVDSTPGSSALTGTWLTGQTALIGERQGGFHFVGNIDEVSMWSKALSAAEVSELYNGGSPQDLTEHSATASLAHWYRLGDSDTFPVVLDHKGAVNGTMQNMTPDAFEEDIP